MKLSKRTRYGIRMMLELAMRYGKEPVQISEIARNEEISPKYLSQLIIPLKNAGYVSSVRGAYGGYTLAQPPGKITLEEIFRVLEGDVCLAECVGNPKSCKRTFFCSTRDIWKMISDNIVSTLRSTTLEDLAANALLKKQPGSFYQI